MAPRLRASLHPPTCRAKEWWELHGRLPWQAREEEAPQPSGYLTLIPLSDARLQPRDARYTAAFLVSERGREGEGDDCSSGHLRRLQQLALRTSARQPASPSLTPRWRLRFPWRWRCSLRCRGA